MFLFHTQVADATLGIRVGRLHAIFKVPWLHEPALFGVDPPGHLGYVEWYSKLPAQANKINGMFPLKRSIRADGKVEAEIIEVIDIRRACHLYPAFGRSSIDRGLTSLTILDAYESFFLNNRLDKDAYRSIHWEDTEDDE